MSKKRNNRGGDRRSSESPTSPTSENPDDFEQGSVPTLSRNTGPGESAQRPSGNIYRQILGRPMAIFMLAAVIVQLGVVALVQLPISLLPKAGTSGITVVTRSPGTDPETVERLLTIPLERSLSDLAGLKHLMSESREGESRIHAIFEADEPIQIRINQASELIQPVAGMFPREVNRPYIVEYSSNDQPIFAFSLSSDQRNLDSLRAYADEHLKTHFSKINGVTEVLITGGNPREIQVVMDPRLLASRSLDPGALARSISPANTVTSAGSIDHGQVRSVNIDSAIEDMEELQTLPDYIGSTSVSHWTSVEDAHREPESISRTDGERRVTVYIKRAASASILSVTEQAAETLNGLKLPPDIKHTVTLNQGESVAESLQSLVNACIQGTVISILVMFVFLRNGRLTVFTALSIPFSVLGVFFFLMLADVGLHAMTLSALALSAGILIDNAIVVSERTYRLYESGTASLENRAEVLSRSTVELMAGTATTLITFIPIAFLSGPTKDRYMDFVITISAALILSLFFALFVLPNTLRQSWLIERPHSLTARIRSIVDGFISQVRSIFGSGFLRPGRPSSRAAGALGPVEQRNAPSVSHSGFGVGAPATKAIFSKGFEFCINHWRKLAIANGIVILSLPVLFWMAPAVSGSTNLDRTLHARVSLPTGIHLERTAQIFDRLESIATKNHFVKKVDAKIEKNQGDLYITLVDDVREGSGRERARESLNKELSVVRPAFVHFDEGGNEDKTYSLRLSFLGSNYAEIKPAIDGFSKQVESVPGVSRVIYHFREPRIYLDFQPDQDVWPRGGPRPAELARSMRYYMTGSVISKLHWTSRELDLRLKGDWKPSMGEQALMSFPVAYQEGSTELRSLGEFKETKGEPTIWRDNKRRALSISVEMKDPAHEKVIEAIHEFFNESVDNPDLTFSVSREYREGQGQIQELILAVVVALVLIYFVLGALLESLLRPLIVMLTIPVPMAAGLGAQLLVDGTLSQVALFALMMLGGLTANGAIIMVSTISQELQDSVSGQQTFPDAMALISTIYESALSRVRPILITCTTTILGMVPLMFAGGSGSALWQPVALITIVGTLISIPTVLLLTPMIFYLLSLRGLKQL